MGWEEKKEKRRNNYNKNLVSLTKSKIEKKRKEKGRKEEEKEINSAKWFLPMTCVQERVEKKKFLKKEKKEGIIITKI